MNLLCLCPTYGRPRLAANAAALFIAQNFWQGHATLLIYDDAGQLPHNEIISINNHKTIHVVSSTHRQPSLVAKYNAMIALYSQPVWDVAVVWDDDDIYYPHHLSSIVNVLAANSFAVATKPSLVWSLYQTNVPFVESGAGRFHGSLAVRRTHLNEIGGWIKTSRMDFDQQMISRCQPCCDMLPGDRSGRPSYVYRWQSTQAHHCSGVAKGPDDETWYDKTPIQEPGEIVQFAPRLDEESARLLRDFEEN